MKEGPSDGGWVECHHGGMLSLAGGMPSLAGGMSSLAGGMPSLVGRMSSLAGCHQQERHRWQNMHASRQSSSHVKAVKDVKWVVGPLPGAPC